MKDKSLQIIRIIAMIFIIMCHLVACFENKYINMTLHIFNVGVYIFLFLSGYLYGNKKIESIKTFYFKRFLKIMIPVYIFLIPLFIIHMYINDLEIRFIFIHIFNLQYIFGGIQGAAHLWFLTVIMICYFVLPIINKVFDKDIKKYNYFIIFITLLSFAIMFYNKMIGTIIFYVIVFLLGYLYRKIEDKLIFNNLIYILLIIISISVRLISKKFLDENIIYDVFIVWLTHLLLAFGIFSFVKNNSKLYCNIKTEIINYLDDISYYIYITHYMFMVGPIVLMNISNNFLINIFITLLISYIYAIILKFFSDKIIKLFIKK